MSAPSALDDLRGFLDALASLVRARDDLALRALDEAIAERDALRATLATAEGRLAEATILITVLAECGDEYICGSEAIEDARRWIADGEGAK